ncbi:hypothetical protein GW932_00175 [archaeon]|nr:hypothetical protein [archaeon]
MAQFCINEELGTFFINDRITITEKDKFGIEEEVGELVYAYHIGDFHFFLNEENKKYHVFCEKEQAWLNESFILLKEAIDKRETFYILEIRRKENDFLFDKNLCLSLWPENLITPEERMEIEIWEFLEGRRFKDFEEKGFTYGIHNPDKTKKKGEELYFRMPSEKEEHFLKRKGSLKQRRYWNHIYQYSRGRRKVWAEKIEYHPFPTIEKELELEQDLWIPIIEDPVKEETQREISSIENKNFELITSSSIEKAFKNHLISQKTFFNLQDPRKEEEFEGDSCLEEKVEEEILQEEDFFHKNLGEEICTTKDCLVDENSENGYDWAGALSIVTNPNYRRLRNW